MMKIVVIGSGYVGTTLAGLLSLSGFEVVALDVDKAKIETINGGRAPFYETGLNELIAAGVASDKLRATDDYENAIKDAEVIFSCVGTPDKPDGSSDLTYVFAAAKTTAKFMKPGVIYVQKSTVPVGTGKKVAVLLPKNTSYVSNPEFLREGSAIADSLLFDRVVAGGSDKPAVAKILDIHRAIAKHAQQIAKIASLDISQPLTTHHGEYIATELESAELIKVTANAFLALKISFANSIAKLSDETGADIIEVMDAIGSDQRIGRAFLNAGRGYGGGCFPKDVSGLIASSLEHGVDMPIMTSATEVNQSMPGYIINKVEEKCGSLSNQIVTVLGLAFKPGTSDTRRSPAVAIANQLSKLSAHVKAYDPEASSEAKPELVSAVNVCTSLAETLSETKIVFIATDWPEFSLENIVEYAPKSATIVDCMNCLDKAKATELGYNYIGVGR